MYSCIFYRRGIQINFTRSFEVESTFVLFTRPLRKFYFSPSSSLFIRSRIEKILGTPTYS